jgi:hypothetical protein
MQFLFLMYKNVCKFTCAKQKAPGESFIGHYSLWLSDRKLASCCIFGAWNLEVTATFFGKFVDLCFDFPFKSSSRLSNDGYKIICVLWMDKLAIDCCIMTSWYKCVSVTKYKLFACVQI